MIDEREINLVKVISGAQNGADISGLRAAKDAWLLTGGSMPKGFRTLDGAKPEYKELYGVEETSNSDYPARTELNVIEVLQQLYGQPWNNLALSYVSALNPTQIRVVNEREGITLDAHENRITVYLGSDDKTIKRIDKECRVRLIGCHDGHELKMQLRYQQEHGTLDEYEYNDASFGIVNDAAINKIDFGE